jgi:dimethylamine monooxygenase subunit A
MRVGVAGLDLLRHLRVAPQVFQTAPRQYRCAMADPILQSRLPHLAWMDPRTARLPGVLPLETDDWIRVDDAYAGQLAERDRLIGEKPDIVHAQLPEGRAAADELYAIVLDRIVDLPGYYLAGDYVTRPDGVKVLCDPDRPLLTLGRLVQQDLCLMEAAPDGHRLTGAILCFPASWTLAQKIGRPLMGIHDGVAPYTGDVGRRVQRMFEAIRVDQPLWRMNFLTYDDPVLHQPRLEGQRRPRPTGHFYIRSERQCFVRLPVTRAVLFSIHTYVVRAETLTAAEVSALQVALR